MVYRHHLDAENLADLSKFKDTARRLALVKGLTDAQAHELAHNGRAIVHIDCGLHATEVAPAQMAIQLAYDLVSAKTPETRPFSTMSFCCFGSPSIPMARISR